MSFLGVAPDVFEKKALGQFDQCSAETIKKVSEDTNVNADQLDVLLNFVSLTAARVPYYRRGVISALESETGKPFDEAVALSKSWQFIMKWLPSMNIGWDSKDCEAFLAQEQPESAKAENYHFFSMLLAQGTILDLLGQRTWSLLVAEDDAGDFICSDNPVGLHSLLPPPPEYVSPFFSHEDTIVTFPLTRELALKGIYTEDNSYLSIEYVPLQLVAGVNSQTMEKAVRYFYSHKDDFSFISASGDVGRIGDTLDHLRAKS